MPFSTKRNQCSSEECLLLGPGGGNEQDKPETRGCERVFKEGWGHVKRMQKPAWMGSCSQIRDNFSSKINNDSKGWNSLNKIGNHCLYWYKFNIESMEGLMRRQFTWFLSTYLWNALLIRKEEEIVTCLWRSRADTLLIKWSKWTLSLWDELKSPERRQWDEHITRWCSCQRRMTSI